MTVLFITLCGFFFLFQRDDIFGNNSVWICLNADYNEMKKYASSLGKFIYYNKLIIYEYVNLNKNLL